MRSKIVLIWRLFTCIGVLLTMASAAQSRVESSTSRSLTHRAGGEPEERAACTLNTRDTICVPAGSYLPFFKRTDGMRAIPVEAFSLDAVPVTQAKYLKFVRRNPQWRKSQVKPLFAEAAYLADWTNDLTPGNRAPQEAVTFVSWFAARAYCADRKRRLPTAAEWERAAGEPSLTTAAAIVEASTTESHSPFRFAMGKQATDLIAPPLRLGNVWEWTMDFNSAPISSSPDGAVNTSSSLFCGDGYRSNTPTDYAKFLRYSFRSSLRANYTLKNLGFRCAG